MLVFYMTTTVTCMVCCMCILYVVWIHLYQLSRFLHDYLRDLYGVLYVYTVCYTDPTVSVVSCSI